ncbi:MAG TPA: GlxA family transcriptional regulator, partial [Terriglobales bacterium]|nr:GlxA family transcriptional regulator [Terriglobales bacterium]
VVTALRSRRAAHSTRHVVMGAFPGVQVLDVVGPMEIFGTATRVLAERRPDDAPPYALSIVAPSRGELVSSSGLRVIADGTFDDEDVPIDTLMVAGGVALPPPEQVTVVAQWLRDAAPRARRIVGICTGAFFLAEAGLLDARRATTHWGACRNLGAKYPAAQVDPDPIFVKDGNVYTSAGVTAGMDLALALVEEDLGREVALAVARRLVMFLIRPGNQAQFSATLAGQESERPRLREIQHWIVDHVAAELSVEALAGRAAMSSRQFTRVFTDEVGMTPARYVERVRVDAARRALEVSALGLEEIAERSGFGSADVMRRAFTRLLQVTPAEYQRRVRRA